MDRETEEFLAQKTAPTPVSAFALMAGNKQVAALEVWTGDVLHVQFACQGCSSVVDIDGSRQQVAFDRESGKLTVQGQVYCTACGRGVTVESGDLQ